MADGNLSYEDFMKLSEKERGKQYQYLSDSDKFKVRQGMVSCTGPYVPCNDCAYCHWGTCKAYPEGIPVSHLNAIVKDNHIECGQGFHFVPKEK